MRRLGRLEVTEMSNCGRLLMTPDVERDRNDVFNFGLKCPSLERIAIREFVHIWVYRLIYFETFILQLARVSSVRRMNGSYWTQHLVNGGRIIRRGRGGCAAIQLCAIYCTSSPKVLHHITALIVRGKYSDEERNLFFVGRSSLLYVYFKSR